MLECERAVRGDDDDGDDMLVGQWQSTIIVQSMRTLHQSTITGDQRSANVTLTTTIEYDWARTLDDIAFDDE